MPESAPLSEQEFRDLIIYTEKFSLQVEAERLLRQSMRQQEELAAKERALAARELAASEKETANALAVAAKEKDGADRLDALLTRSLKKPGFWCAVKKVFTLGMAACSR